MLNKISLRMRLTILTSVVLIILCILLRGISIYVASDIFFKPFENILLVEAKSNDINVDNNSNSHEISDNLISFFASSQHQFVEIINIYTLIIIAMGSFCIWIICYHALKPLTKLSKNIENISENNLKEKLILREGKDEICQLTLSFNNMLTKLEVAFESQKRFANNVAHELKTPIASIITNIEVFEMDDNPSVNECLETIDVLKEQGERMNNLVKDLLQLNSSYMGDNNEIFSVLEIFYNITYEFRNIIEEKNIELKINGDVNIKGSKALLERAFANIIQNAIKYNRENGSIIISCLREKIIICDTGIGIPNEKLDKIFEPFYCIDTSRSRELGGSGLGLYIVKQIFDKHNMNIYVKSNKEGTTFEIEVKNLN